MAADQRRKRLHGASIDGFNSLDRCKTKKKRQEPLRNHLNTKGCISLEWDGNKKKVVSKREQIGLSWRHLRPFTDSTPHHHRVLADVSTLPREVFDLENLTKVLSYEAWQTHLSESERNLLMQFLPKGIDEEQVLRALFSRDNFHYGNQFLKWGTSLCSGHLHPDTIIQEERRLKAEKKTYYSELQDYHNDMIEYLRKLKENWESCKDPEQEIVQKLWRSKDVTVTSESCSWVADEKSCSSDNQNSSIVKDGEMKRSRSEKVFIKEIGQMLLTGEARSKKGDKIRKRNIQQCDGAKYMSCFKISKKQHDIVKNMEQSGRSIQSRSLTRVLGDIDTLHVQPYEVFMEEEKRRLDEYWLKLVKEDLPASYANWREMQLQKRNITKSLEQDMTEKLNLLLEDKEDEDTLKLQDQETNLDVLGIVEEDPEKLLEDEKDTEATESDSSMEERESVLALADYQSPKQNSSFDSGQMCNHVESENNDNISKSDPASSDALEQSDNLNTADATVSQDVPVCSAEIVWPTDGMPHPYHDSIADRKYTSTYGLPSIHQDNEDQHNKMIDPELDLHKETTGKSLLHRNSEDDSFGSCTNQDQNELLQSFFKDQGVLSYQSEQKQAGLDFQPLKYLLVEDGHLNRQFHEQLQSSLLLEERQKRQNEVYMQQPNMSQNIYSAGDRYLTPRQEHQPSGNMQNWDATPARMPAPSRPQLNSRDFLTQNWLTGEQRQVQVHGGWAGSDGFSGHSQSILSASNADQSLFSVLSHCNQFPSGSSYDLMGTTEQFIPPRNNGMIRAGTSGIVGNSLQQATQSLDYLGTCDAPTSLMAVDDPGWMIQWENHI